MRLRTLGVALAMLVVACTSTPDSPTSPPTQRPTSPGGRSELPTPVPLGLEGDDLYEEYRRGLISRHLASNGRLLETVALESVDEAFHQPGANRRRIPFWRAFDGTIRIQTSAGRSFTFPVANARYSVERNADRSEVVGLWVPMLGAVKAGPAGGLRPPSGPAATRRSPATGLTQHALLPIHSEWYPAGITVHPLRVMEDGPHRVTLRRGNSRPRTEGVVRWRAGSFRGRSTSTSGTRFRTGRRSRRRQHLTARRTWCTSSWTMSASPR